jgi:hypothetical protein
MFQAADSILELRAYAEDMRQMITVLDCGFLQENHRFNMQQHSKLWYQHHQHDMQ